MRILVAGHCGSEVVLGPEKCRCRLAPLSAHGKATNAVRHGRTRGEATAGHCPTSQDERPEEITLVLTAQADAVAIEVQDNSPQTPVQGAPERFSTSGRGLSLVAAIADSWTTCPTEDGTGKRVSALLKRP